MAFICAACHNKSNCKHHGPEYGHPQGEHKAWPGEIVWLPDMWGMVSVGPCEDCKKSRPCVNCRG